MKQKALIICVMLIAFTMLPSTTEAKNIKFGMYITYKGKVVNGQPMGKGKLIIVNKDPMAKKHAIVEGEFDGWTVGADIPALIYFYSEGHYPYFVGKAEIKIEEDGSSVIFKLISGSISDYVEGTSIEGKTNNDIVMTCTPKDDGIYLSSTPFESSQELNKKTSRYATKYQINPEGEPHQRNPKYWNNEKRWDWYSLCSCQYEGKNKVIKRDYAEVYEDCINESMIVYRENTVTYIIKDGSSFVFDDKEYGYGNNLQQKKVSSFKIPLSDGILEYSNDTVKYTNLQGKQYTVLYYDKVYNQIKKYDQYKLMDNRSYKSLSGLGFRRFEGAAYTTALELIGYTSAEAEFDLGIAFLKGDGVDKDVEEGKKLIEEAASRKEPRALAYLKEKEAVFVTYEKEKEKQRDALMMAPTISQALKSGKAGDYWLVGLAYESGKVWYNEGYKEITINLDAALDWYKKAAAIDPAYEKYVTAVSYKKKTGLSYFEDKPIVDAKNKAKKKAIGLRSKYGAAYVNSLINTGNIKVGTPLALLKEYIAIINPWEEEKRKGSSFGIMYYEPTTRDMMQYGRTAKRVKICDDIFFFYSLMVANGKVVAVYEQSSALKLD